MDIDKTILVINGSYRDDGIIDQAVDSAVQAIKAAGGRVEVVVLRELAIDFCLNCRECTQKPGDAPGECVLDDGMQTLIDKLERADGYVLASPTNFGTVTSLFKRFMERLIAYAYWPWGANAPKFRKSRPHTKKAFLISACAAPGFFGRRLYTTHTQLKTTAKTLGAKPVSTLSIGLISGAPVQRISKRVDNKARALAMRVL